MPYLMLLKYGGILALILTLCVGLIQYGSHRKQLEWNASIAKQAVQSASNVIKGAQNTAKVETKYIRAKAKTKIVTKIIKEEVIKYVERPHPVCSVDRQFERVWDRASVRLSTPASAANEPLDVSDSGLTDTEIISAHADDARRYYELRDAYLALVEWVTTTYAIQKEGAGHNPA